MSISVSFSLAVCWFPTVRSCQSTARQLLFSPVVVVAVVVVVGQRQMNRSCVRSQFKLYPFWCLQLHKLLLLTLLTCCTALSTFHWEQCKTLSIQCKVFSATEPLHPPAAAGGGTWWWFVHLREGGGGVCGLFLARTDQLTAPVFTKSWKTYVSPRLTPDNTYFTLPRCRVCKVLKKKKNWYKESSIFYSILFW